MHLIVLAGLPGTGKSTLARTLSERLAAPVLDKDRVRGALFGSAFVEYSRAQDDHCVDLCLRTAEWLASRECRAAILDGRTFTRAADLTGLRERAMRAGLDLCLVECVCAQEVALARIEADLREGAHPAEDRTADLYHRLADRAEPVEAPELVVRTDEEPLDAAADRVVEALERTYST